MATFLSSFVVGNTRDKFYNVTINNEYIKMFWVGLMDGEGSIQVNHSRMKSLQYRLIIKLSNNEYNYNMLILISKNIGGTVRIVKSKKEVIWVVDNKETIISIIDIFNDYTPLTSRLICQLKFLRICLENNSVKYYKKKRNLKFSEQEKIINNFSISYITRSYFPIWLSGFLEAEGCFSIRENNNSSFSINHKYDFYLLSGIKSFFDLKVTIRNTKKNFYLIESYSSISLHRIIKHCTTYPLLGAKSISLNKLIKLIH